MDTSVALSSSFLGLISSKLSAENLKTMKIIEKQHSSEDAFSPVLSSRPTAAPRLFRTSSIGAPGTPTITTSWFRNRMSQSRRSSCEEHPALLGSTAGQSTQQEGWLLSHSSSTVSAYHAHSSNRATSSSNSNSSRPRSQVGCVPSVTAHIKRPWAWTAKVLQHRASCPANMQLQRLPSSSTTSSTRSFPGAAPEQQHQQQEMQPLVTSHPLMRMLLSSSQSWPGLHPVLATEFGSAAVEHGATSSCVSDRAAATCHFNQQPQPVPQVAAPDDTSQCPAPQTPPGAAPAAAAAAPLPAPFGSGPPARVTAWQPPPLCTEITPYDDSSDNSNAGAPDSLRHPYEAASRDCPLEDPYPDCLFSDTPCLTNSFTTRFYTSNQGQKVAIVRTGDMIMAVYVKEPSGDVWECDPDQVTFPGDSSSQTQTAAAGTECAAAGKGSTRALTAHAAARAYHALNRSSSRGSAGSRRHQWGSHIRSASGAFLSSSGSSSNSWFDSQKVAGHLPGAGSTTASDDSRLTGVSCNSMLRSHSSAPSMASKQRHSMLASLISRIREWRKQRKEQQQRQAAAYLEELEQGARLAMRLAGCHSFVLPRHWSGSARAQAKEQRRLRVLLAACKA